jgi:hypothetical protein
MQYLIRLGEQPNYQRPRTFRSGKLSELSGDDVSSEEDSSENSDDGVRDPDEQEGDDEVKERAVTKTTVRTL